MRCRMPSIRLFVDTSSDLALLGHLLLEEKA
jgi:hypothetical protein